MTTDSDTASATPSSTVFDRARPLTALFVAVILIIGFLIFVAVLNAGADSANSEVWQRRIYLLGGVEAIVFTAVGWLFGREVNRQQVDRAESQVQQADSRAREAEQRALDEGTRAADLAARGEGRQGGRTREEYCL